MLSQATVDSLLQPVSESLPSGEDLEYNSAFMALEADARPKAEQQFGDTVIAAVEPEWRDLLNRSIELLAQSKDVRLAVLTLRAATRTQGIAGFSFGMSLLTQMLDRFWDSMHPLLDTEDNNDPTMRLNALAPMTDSEMLLRDLQEAQFGMARGIGAIKMRDLMVALSKVNASSSDSGFTLAQIEGGLSGLFTERPELIEAGAMVATQVQQLQRLIIDKTGQADAIDLKPLLSIAQLAQQACKQASGGSNSTAEDSSSESDLAHPGTHSSGGNIRGDINSRQDALLMLDKVIVYLERTEPGNPAPLLIQRAKRLVGVSFLSIMEDLAPDALGTIQNITGRPNN
jgi:type VI secretion system protein ImpA